MSQSTRLITASYILSFVAANAPQKLRTETIAKWVKIHPARVRNLVSQMVKADILASCRGPKGGLTLARPAAQITLQDVYDAVQESSLIAEKIDNPFSGMEEHCKVFDVFTRLFSLLERNMRQDLANITADQLFVAFDPPLETDRA
ncbi:MULTISPECIES: RrF2 family transcriptional regulator [Pseudomonas]|uniref:Transcriptional regulator n=3 Tax=Pseudomonas TaxID=286 RepID=U6ZM27_9PSED|nr:MULTISPECIES: Rrf2 family transcriptional regulator [Pseudomonas]AZC18851.1 Rrf2 family transcriptional regulator, group III [Pseudomonas sp. CMR5c]AZC24415.1 Rrf2 family transcriptional regulator, group III [Pseudomonas sessilinigenes]ERO60443.1 Rrf2 family transcriptional regulator [Pseudomonas piscis]MCU7646856.1 Rrf2 family transcriptional regulator [Pseudomonas piscis]MQA53940.1 transcriptional regulator [Pseudomonas piscis]